MVKNIASTDTATITREDGGPAFPNEQSMNPDGLWNDTLDPGMSLRDYFAAHATDKDVMIGMEMMKLQGLLSTPAGARYAHADAMLEARKDA